MGEEENTGVKGIYRKRLAEVGIERLPYMDAYPNLVNYWSDSLGLPREMLLRIIYFVMLDRYKTDILTGLNLARIIIQAAIRCLKV